MRPSHRFELAARLDEDQARSGQHVGEVDPERGCRLVVGLKLGGGAHEGIDRASATAHMTGGLLDGDGGPTGISRIPRFEQVPSTEDGVGYIPPGQLWAKW